MVEHYRYYAMGPRARLGTLSTIGYSQHWLVRMIYPLAPQLLRQANRDVFAPEQRSRMNGRVDTSSLRLRVMMMIVGGLVVVVETQRDLSCDSIQCPTIYAPARAKRWHWQPRRRGALGNSPDN